MRDELDATGPPGAEASAPCAVCGEQTVLCCSGCEAVFYCSAEHQQQDWRSHRRVCSRKPTGQPTTVANVSPGNDASIGRISPSPRSPASPGAVSRVQSETLVGLNSPDPSNIFAHHAAWTTTRDRRLQLRASAVLASREGRHKDAMLYAAEAYELAQTILRQEGDDMNGSPEKESATLVEILLICRAACAEGNHAVGKSFLRKLLELTDRLAGTGGSSALFEPSAAATLLMSVSELCSLYDQNDNAEDYGHAFLAMARVAQGEGSAFVGDAHAFLMGLLTKWGRHEEALLHANMLLQIRQRGAKKGLDKAVADAYWNIASLKFQLGQHDGALESLKLSRDIHYRLSGEGQKTSDLDVAIGTLHRIMTQYKQAVTVLRTALRARQRFYGFAHAETRRVAALLDAAELELKTQMDTEVRLAETRLGGGSPLKSPLDDGTQGAGQGGQSEFAKARQQLQKLKQIQSRTTLEPQAQADLAREIEDLESFIAQGPGAKAQADFGRGIA